MVPRGAASAAGGRWLPRAEAAPRETDSRGARRAPAKEMVMAMQSVSELLEAIRHPDPKVRMKAAQALGYMSAAAKGAVPALIGALQDENAKVRMNAARAL